MKSEIKEKLLTIGNIWGNYIWQYKFCSSKIKFNSDIQTNYFRDILRYFHDTLDIVFEEEKITTINSEYKNKISYTISFLQAIYIQQDFILEMLEIFKTNINKGNLKQDKNYSKNRKIRNELVGHPIRKRKGKFISSVFGYHEENDKIEYLIYYKDNNLKFENKVYSILDIKTRHSIFLNKYLDIILDRLMIIIDNHLEEITKIEKIIINNKFETLLNVTELYFEHIFKSDHIYDKDSLLIVYSKRKKHIRYQNLINEFCKELNIYIKEIKLNRDHLFEPKIKEKIINDKLEVEYIDNIHENLIEKTPNYLYDLGKLSDNKSIADFDLHSNSLIKKCDYDDLVTTELKNMKLNYFNEIEYYCSLQLIKNHLSKSKQK